MSFTLSIHVHGSTKMIHTTIIRDSRRQAIQYAARVIANFASRRGISPNAVEYSIQTA